MFMREGARERELGREGGRERERERERERAARAEPKQMYSEASCSFVVMFTPHY